MYGVQHEGAQQVFVEGANGAAYLLAAGLKYRTISIFLGVVGFFFGMAAGVVAFPMARKAEDHGVSATAARVRAIVDVIFGIIGGHDLLHREVAAGPAQLTVV